MVVRLVSLVLLGLLWTGTAEAAPCTPGTDCYCDKAKNPASPLYDPKLIWCEDFEAPTLICTGSNAPACASRLGNGAPYYGPHYDQNGSCNFGVQRGCNSWWAKVYPDYVAGHWNSPDPASPTYGSPCVGGSCPGLITWDAANRWSGNAYTPVAAFFSASSDFSAEIGTILPPTNAAGGTSGIFDGNSMMTYRMPPGNTAGILGTAAWGATYFEVGLTQAVAYPQGNFASGIWGPTDGSKNAAWKHNEWRSVASPNCGYDGIFLNFNQQAQSSRPFGGFIGSFGNCIGSGGITGGAGGTYCNAIVATVGTAGCNSAVPLPSAINWQASTSLYNHDRDFPEGTWGCVRGHMTGIGTTSARMRLWFTPTAGPNRGTELLLLDFTYNDDSGSNLDNRQGYNGLKWNAYANTNQSGYIPSTALTFRYEDNVHITNGLPVSCAAIGFSSGSAPDTTPPATPTGLIVSKVTR